MTEQTKTKKHISYSELSNWNKCPWYHKLVYIDGLSGFKGNAYTAFGSAIHDVAEQLLLENITEPVSYFEDQFATNIAGLLEDGIELNDGLLADMRKQGAELSEVILPALRTEFGQFEIIATEYQLYEDMTEDMNLEKELFFKGYIDLIIKTPDGKYRIIDYKTCSWGWRAEKKSDKIINYQLVLYKYFYAKKNNIDLKDIECHFILLKRTARKNIVEPFRITSGNKKVQNSLDFMKKALYNIGKGVYIKNRMNCNYCDFLHTENCKR